MQVICLEEEAFFKLVELVVGRLQKTAQEEVWISPQEAMRLLNIKSKSTLAELRYQGKIRYSQPQKKVIVYDKQSLFEYLEGSVHETFT
jgi:hypothetical protein